MRSTGLCPKTFWSLDLRRTKIKGRHVSSEQKHMFLQIKRCCAQAAAPAVNKDECLIISSEKNSLFFSEEIMRRAGVLTQQSWHHRFHRQNMELRYPSRKKLMCLLKE